MGLYTNRKDYGGWFLPLMILFWIRALLNLYFGLLSLVLFFVVFAICQPFFERWAKEIGKSPAIPFVLVMLFGLPGQVGYYVYYRSVRK